MIATQEMPSAFESAARREVRLLHRVRAGIDRTRYRVQQWSLAAAFGTGAHLWHRVLSPRHPATGIAPIRALVNRLNELVERDVANVERGYYPRDLLFQIPVLQYLRAAPEFLGDVPFILRRYRRKEFRDLPKSMDLDDYPPYYRQTFHWQTHGWLSHHSARMYDLGVDFLFWGAADAMRRMLIPGLVDELRAARRPPRILDVACGTGRFLAQLHRALPRAKLYGVDLSPFYVEKARRAASKIPEITITAENAEALPFDDGSFDAVTSIFLFHELPKSARRKVWNEMRRVAKPGAPILIADSPQSGDEGVDEVEPLLQLFPSLYHEPYFADYVRDRFSTSLPQCGIDVEREERFLVTKVTSARRPVEA